MLATWLAWESRERNYVSGSKPFEQRKLRMCFRPGASAWTCPGPRSSTAEATGELSYLKWLAEKHPQQFASLYGRIIPLEMNLKAETPKRVVYPSLDDTRAALRARGGSTPT
jgi:hypothetical protein